MLSSLSIIGSYKDCFIHQSPASKPASAMHVMNRIRNAIFERSNAPEAFQKFESSKNRSDIFIGSTSKRVIIYSVRGIDFCLPDPTFIEQSSQPIVEIPKKGTCMKYSNNAFPDICITRHRENQRILISSILVWTVIAASCLSGCSTTDRVTTNSGNLISSNTPTEKKIDSQTSDNFQIGFSVDIT